MNTERSDARIQAWATRTNRLKRVTLVPERTIAAPPDKIFPLLCPTREYDWIATWRGELLHSESGGAEHDAIFRTRQAGVEEIWICTRYEPNREIHYVRFAKGLLTKLEITLIDLGDGTTRVCWLLTASALVEEMTGAVADLAPGGSRIHQLERVLDELEHYLETGEMRGEPVERHSPDVESATIRG